MFVENDPLPIASCVVDLFVNILDFLLLLQIARRSDLQVLNNPRLNIWQHRALDFFCELFVLLDFLLKV